MAAYRWDCSHILKVANKMLEINTLTPGCCLKYANNKRNAFTCLKQTVTCMSRLVYCYSFHWPADTWKVQSWEVTCYVNEAHNGEFYKNKMIKIRTKYSFQLVLSYHLIIYWRVTEKLKGHIQRIFLNLLLFCMLTEYVQSIILLKTA